MKSNGKWRTSRANLSAYVKEDYCSFYEKGKGTKFRKFRRAASRDIGTYAPGLGQFSQGVYWFFYNFVFGGIKENYLRYFKTASNNGGFFGDNYCNGNRQLVKSQW